MAELTTVAQIVAQFYRLTGTVSADAELVRHGEAVDAVAYEALTEGSRMAQMFMLDAGYQGWRKRSSALSWTGTDDTLGGRYSALPSDFLRIYTTKKPYRSGIIEADGTGWGSLIDADEDHLRGDHYYVRDEQVWLTRDASPPTTVYLQYHYVHPAWSSGVTIDFPMRVRGLLAPSAAWVAMNENWLPGGQDMETKINRALRDAERRARQFARQTKEPRRFHKPTRIANRW